MTTGYDGSGRPTWRSSSTALQCRFCELVVCLPPCRSRKRSSAGPRLNAWPLGGWGSVVARPFLITCAGLGCECPLCQARCAGARCAGVVRWPVVLLARRARRDRVLGVIPTECSLCQRGSVLVWCAHAGSRQASFASAPNPPFLRNPSLVRVQLAPSVRG
jgi:hypothetical protein